MRYSQIFETVFLEVSVPFDSHSGISESSWHLHEKIREVCIKARSSAPSLAVIGQVNKHTSVKWPIPGIVCFTPERFKHYNQVLPNCRLQTAEPAEPIFFVKKIKWKEKEKPKNLIQFSKISFSGLKKITLKTKFVFIVVDLEVPWDFKIVATYVRCHSIPQHSINMAEWKRKCTRYWRGSLRYGVQESEIVNVNALFSTSWRTTMLVCCSIISVS